MRGEERPFRRWLFSNLKAVRARLGGFGANTLGVLGISEVHARTQVGELKVGAGSWNFLFQVSWPPLI